MIHEIDETLKSFVKREAIEGSGADVVFEAPTKDWASRRNTPTVDIYLYDIREDNRRRAVGVYEVRDGDGLVTERHAPPRYFRMSYLVTAWTQRPEDEHRLLAALLSAFLRFDYLPMELLVGTTARLGLPVGMEVAKPPADGRQISDTWSALGGELKASLDLVVVAPITPSRIEFTAPTPTAPLNVRATGTGGQGEEYGGGRPPRPLPEDAAEDEEPGHGGANGKTKTGSARSSGSAARGSGSKGSESAASTGSARTNR